MRLEKVSFKSNFSFSVLKSPSQINWTFSLFVKFKDIKIKITVHDGTATETVTNLAYSDNTAIYSAPS